MGSTKEIEEIDSQMYTQYQTNNDDGIAKIKECNLQRSLLIPYANFQEYAKCLFSMKTFHIYSYIFNIFTLFVKDNSLCLDKHYANYC